MTDRQVQRSATTLTIVCIVFSDTEESRVETCEPTHLRLSETPTTRKPVQNWKPYIRSFGDTIIDFITISTAVSSFEGTGLSK